ncbi:thiamine phosphate synthase [Vagococcus lutrae]|uniref:thiamine phosphate synthase n=1 Tax=Vagococcus lutrae TaxID=81947 RepID=UPI00200E95E0|nr:thiamine phosphate synthase [Vagococcus lutrae]MDT2807592.1 thiamine phosphate synthase [Vagococcus lutrae]UQF71380.1 thiamine phosphate synthase [Vagococcus lutrae]
MTINWQDALAVYFIAGTQDIQPNEELIDVLEEALKAGATCFQYREKGTGSMTNPDERLDMARRCQEVCKRYDVPFIINDDIDLAIEVQADALHVGQSDTPIAETLDYVAPFGIEVGLSTNNLRQYQEAAEIDGVAYVGVGPIFPTQSKSDAQPTVGLSLLAEIDQLDKRKPAVAIGGISLANIAQVANYEVSGVALISAITQSKNRKQTIKAFREALKK